MRRGIPWYNPTGTHSRTIATLIPHRIVALDMIDPPRPTRVYFNFQSTGYCSPCVRRLRVTAPTGGVRRSARPAWRLCCRSRPHASLAADRTGTCCQSFLRWCTPSLPPPAKLGKKLQAHFAGQFRPLDTSGRPRTSRLRYAHPWPPLDRTSGKIASAAPCQRPPCRRGTEPPVARPPVYRLWTGKSSPV